MRDFEARLDYLRHRTAGWFNGREGQPVTDIAFEVATMILKSPAMYKFQERPGIFPTPDGGLSLEFWAGLDSEIEISPLGIITGNTELFGLGTKIDNT